MENINIDTKAIIIDWLIKRDWTNARVYAKGNIYRVTKVNSDLTIVVVALDEKGYELDTEILEVEEVTFFKPKVSLEDNQI